jgi:hypothetical protein
VRRGWLFILFHLVWPSAVSANLPSNASPFLPKSGASITNIFDTGGHLCQVKLVGGAAPLFYDAQSFDELGWPRGVNFGNGTASSYGFPGRSPLTHSDPQGLLDAFSGKGEPVGKVPRGQPGFKERVNFGQKIGEINGQSTTKGIIHYSKTGAHIVPANP